MIREILKFGHPALYKRCLPIHPNGDAAQIADDLVDTLLDTSNGIGLAAPQIGHLFRVIAVWPGRKGTPRIMINPEIVSAKGQSSFKEACLSYPGVEAVVPRFKRVTVRYLNYRGIEVFQKARGMESIVIQHEVDHLDGVCHVGVFWKMKSGVKV